MMRVRVVLRVEAFEETVHSGFCYLPALIRSTQGTNSRHSGFFYWKDQFRGKEQFPPHKFLAEAVKTHTVKCQYYSEDFMLMTHIFIRNKEKGHT